MLLTSIINGAPIERKRIGLWDTVMQPDETIEDVLERIALAGPRYGHGTASVEARKRRVELSGEKRRNSFSCETSGASGSAAEKSPRQPVAKAASKG